MRSGAVPKVDLHRRAVIYNFPGLLNLLIRYRDAAVSPGIRRSGLGDLCALWCVEVLWLTTASRI